MKKNILFFILFTLFFSSYSQNKTWNRYEMDTIFSIEFPNDVYEFDTIVKKMKLQQLISYDDEHTFLLQKINLEENNLDKNYSKLPYDLKSLNKSYKQFSRGIIQKSKGKIFSQEEIMFDKYHGYRIIFNSDESNPALEFNLFHLNGYMYSAIYSSQNKLNDSISKRFLNSIIINSNGINQFGGKSQSYRIGYLVGRFSPYLFIFGVILYLIFRKRKKHA